MNGAMNTSNGYDIYERGRESNKRHKDLEHYVKSVFSVSPFSNHIHVEYVVLNPCELNICTNKQAFIDDLVERCPNYGTDTFHNDSFVSHSALKAAILNKQVEGFLCIKDLISVTAQKIERCCSKLVSLV